MGGIDRLVSNALSSEIKKEMDMELLSKVERELFLEHGMSIKLSIEHFQKFSSVLKKNSNLDVNKFERDCINKILRIKKTDGKYFVTILDSNLSDLILGFFGENDSRKIITTLLEKEFTIPQILKESEAPKTSGYRKIENMIINGLIIETGKILSESKKISKLQCVFQEINLEIKKGKTIVNGIISQKMMEKSTSMKVILDSIDA
ncbi:transcriptional regulator [Nitrosopumilus sp. b3]|uniref:transcriptional regulator n=1 Tax=Nitrosopumilus sp. b3 TaxID=2109909 RepID=UPI0015F4C830|nr:transcriptional regulator [Nitrosopumilus sp. b3]KAF6247967.1 transcriptional regulator [Nitrosopumilus sp. b3]